MAAEFEDNVFMFASGDDGLPYDEPCFSNGNTDQHVGQVAEQERINGTVAADHEEPTATEKILQLLMEKVEKNEKTIKELSER